MKQSSVQEAVSSTASVQQQQAQILVESKNASGAVSSVSTVTSEVTMGVAQEEKVLDGGDGGVVVEEKKKSKVERKGSKAGAGKKKGNEISKENISVVSFETF